MQNDVDAFTDKSCKTRAVDATHKGQFWITVEKKESIIIGEAQN